jgi:hypothetical protein
MTVDLAQIDRPARATAWAEHVQPGRPSDQRGPDRRRPQHVPAGNKLLIPTLDDGGASARAAAAATCRLAFLAMSGPRVRTPMRQYRPNPAGLALEVRPMNGGSGFELGKFGFQRLNAGREWHHDRLMIVRSADSGYRTDARAVSRTEGIAGIPALPPDQKPRRSEIATSVSASADMISPALLAPGCTAHSKTLMSPPACARPLRHVPPFGSTSIIAALSRPNAAWNFFFLPLVYAERSFFASLTKCFTIAFFSFGLGVLRITIVCLLLRKNSAGTLTVPSELGAGSKLELRPIQRKNRRLRAPYP